MISLLVHAGGYLVLSTNSKKPLQSSQVGEVTELEIVELEEPSQLNSQPAEVNPQLVATAPAVVKQETPVKQTPQLYTGKPFVLGGGAVESGPITQTVVEHALSASERIPTVQATTSVASVPIPGLPAGDSMNLPSGGSSASKPGNVDKGTGVAYLSSKATYPERAIKRNQEGLVMLRVTLSAEGVPISVTVEESSGHELLDSAALNAVKKWRFTPPTVNNVATGATVNVPVRFKLH